jgi:hypothetical protein
VHPTQSGKMFPVAEALQRVPQPASESEALVYDLNLQNGTALTACLYIVYATPLGQVADPTTGEVLHSWLKVSRDRCTKGCCGPVMAAIQRLGRQGRMQGAAVPEGAIPFRGGNETESTVTERLAACRLCRAGLPRSVEEHEASLRERGRSEQPC